MLRDIDIRYTELKEYVAVLGINGEAAVRA